LLQDARALAAYRPLIRLLVIGQLKQRYRRSALGLAWALIGPLVHTAVLSIAFTALFRDQLPHYPVYVLVGLVAWNFFAQTSSQGIEAAVSGSGLLQRVYLPRSVFVVAALGGGLVNLAIALVALLGVAAASGAPLHLTWLLLPAAVALLAIFTLGVTLLAATLAVYVGDVAHLYQLMVQALFFLTPVAYPAEIVPDSFAWVVALSPVSLMIALFRDLLYLGRVPEAGTWLAALAVALGALACGWALFAWKADDSVAYL
jgi:ABC-type polysaccharide/polyol phosphate export permease